MFDGAEHMRFLSNDLVILHDARCHQDDLKALEGDLLRLATFARGWDIDILVQMQEVFKVDPFYNATSLVLVFCDGVLLGTAGVDADIAAGPEGGHIIHLCSVNLLSKLRTSGIVALLLVLLSDRILAKLPQHASLYFTSISQSPLVYSLIAKIARLYPDGATQPPPEVVEVARRVAAKYDGHLVLEPDALVLRNECAFFYKDVPYVADPKINRLFDQVLDIPAGDVFVNVGKTSVKEAAQTIERYRYRFQALVRST